MPPESGLWTATSVAGCRTHMALEETFCLILTRYGSIVALDW
jgi:hypothetical protein